MTSISSIYVDLLSKIQYSEAEDLAFEDVHILRRGESVFGRATVMNEVANPSEDLDAYLEAREDAWEEEVALSDTETVDYIQELFDEFNRSFSLEPNAEIKNSPVLRFVAERDTAILETSVSIEPTTSIVQSNLPQGAELLHSTSQMIPSVNSLRSMSVRLTDFAYDSDDWDTPHHDFTIYFATEEPHTYWANCETLEDYFEMVAENNDDTTVADMREKDEYYSHTHLMRDKKEVIDWLEEFTTAAVSEAITADETLTVFPYHLEVDFQTEEVTFECEIRKQFDF